MKVLTAIPMLKEESVAQAKQLMIRWKNKNKKPKIKKETWRNSLATDDPHLDPNTPLFRLSLL